MRRALRSATLFTLAALSATLVAGAPAAAPRPPPKHRVVVADARARRLPAGWRQITGAPNLLSPRGTQSEATITSWAYRPNSRGPAGSLPRGGILITVSLNRLPRGGSNPKPNLCLHTPKLPGFPSRVPPLQVASTPAPGGLEGEPGVVEYRTLGRFGDEYNFDVRVDIKSPHPAALRRAAAAVVRRIDLPRWPHRTSC